MKLFKDTADRTWIVNINVNAVRKVRTVLNVDLVAMIDDGCKPLGELMADPVKFIDVLYVLCQDQNKISDEEFGKAMGGDALEQAMDAFTEGLIDFFPNPRVRENLRKMAEAGRNLKEKLADKMDLEMQMAVNTMAEMSADDFLKRLIPASGKSPGSAESTPDLLASAN